MGIAGIRGTDVNGGGSIAPGVVEMVGETGPEPEGGALLFDFGGAEIDMDAKEGLPLAPAAVSTSLAFPFALAVAAAFSNLSFFALSIFMLFR
jgi:hypothetical protein